MDFAPDTCEASQRCYLTACEGLGVRHMRCVFEGLVHEKLSCKGHVMLPNDVKAACVAILVGQVF